MTYGYPRGRQKNSIIIITVRSVSVTLVQLAVVVALEAGIVTEPVGVAVQSSELGVAVGLEPSKASAKAWSKASWQ